MVTGQPPRKTFTPALIAALVGLVVLAAVTVIVLVNSGDKSDDTASSSSSQSASPASASKSASGSETSTAGGKPAGSVKADDGSFSFDPPAGFQDAFDEVSVAGALAAVKDPSSDAGFPTHVVINAESSKASLEEIEKAVRAQIEKKFSTTTESGSPKLDSVDGEKFRAWSTGDYKDGTQDVTSGQIITQHNGKVYYFTVNTLPANRSAAGQALVELVKSVKWS